MKNNDYKHTYNTSCDVTLIQNLRRVAWRNVFATVVGQSPPTETNDSVVPLPYNSTDKLVAL